MNPKTVLLIEDYYPHFEKISKLLSEEWDVLPNVANQSELTNFLFSADTIKYVDRRISATEIKNNIIKYLNYESKYKYISIIILDISLSDIIDPDNLDEGYAVLNAIRNLILEDKVYIGWNKVVPIIIISQYKDKVRKALSGNAITNLCLNKQEIFEEKNLLNSYLEHLYKYFEIVRENLFHFNSLNTNIKEVSMKINTLTDNLNEMQIEISILLNAVFKELKPSQRQELIDKFDDYLPPEFKLEFGPLYIDKLKEDLKRNVDDIELFTKTLQYAPITVFTTIRDIVMNLGLYPLKKRK
jgi:CheY-like chemotaxis protein